MKNSIYIPIVSSTSFIKTVIVVFLSGIILSSCNNPSEIGLSVQPKSDKINLQYTDTFSLVTKTISGDSMASYSAASNLLGSYVDPVFGKVSGSFYAEPNLSGVINVVGTNPVADSIVLSLVYDGYYGDLNTTQSVSVYEMEENITQNTPYYSNQNFAYNNEALGSLVFTPNPKDSITIGGVRQVPQLRIKLNNSLANRILNANSATLSSNTVFNSFFKGIYLKAADITSSGRGAILYFSLQNIGSGITIYFHNSSASGLSLNLVFNSLSASVNHFDHDYSGTVVAQKLNTSSDTLYAQSMAGVKTFIDFPYLKNLVASGNVAINKAELLVYVSDNSNSLYPPPANMVLYYLDANGVEQSLPDYTVSTFQVPLTNGNLYDFVLDDFVQRVLSGNITSYGLHLVPALGIAQANRVIIGGGKSPVNPMKLAITYTKL